jgi:hypothetical protein
MPGGTMVVTGQGTPVPVGTPGGTMAVTNQGTPIAQGSTTGIGPIINPPIYRRPREAPVRQIPAPPAAR